MADVASVDIGDQVGTPTGAGVELPVSPSGNVLAIGEMVSVPRSSSWTDVDGERAEASSADSGA